MKNNKNNIDTHLNINVNKDEPELNDFLYCWKEFGNRPNKLVINNNYSGGLFIDVIENHKKDDHVIIEITPSEEKMIFNEKSFCKLDNDIYCSFIILDKKGENSIVSEVVFYFANKTNLDKIQSIVEELNSCLLDFCEESTNNLNTITLAQTGLEIEPVETSVDLECFEMFYSKKTMKEITKLTKSIKKSNKGLSILFGERGVGKTSVVSYLASKLDRIVIFIPNNMIENTINNSEFRRFLKRYDRPIIVIDDCEMLLNEFFNKSNIFSNNLLQMIDGLLSDSIEANVVAIFNVEKEDEIDHSLIECNNLLKLVEFEKLHSDEATELSDYLGHKKKIKNKSRLIDIIKNQDTDNTNQMGL